MAPLGWLLLLTSVAYLVAVVVRREPIRVCGFELPLPPPRIGFAQLGVSVVDWALAAAVLYVLLPPSDLSFLGPCSAPSWRLSCSGWPATCRAALVSSRA